MNNNELPAKESEQKKNEILEYNIQNDILAFYFQSHFK